MKNRKGSILNSYINYDFKNKICELKSDDFIVNSLGKRYLYNIVKNRNMALELGVSYFGESSGTQSNVVFFSCESLRFVLVEKKDNEMLNVHPYRFVRAPRLAGLMRDKVRLLNSFEQVEMTNKLIELGVCVPKIYEFDEDYMIKEYIDGISFQEYLIKSDRIDLDLVYLWFKQLDIACKNGVYVSDRTTVNSKIFEGNIYFLDFDLCYEDVDFIMAQALFNFVWHVRDKVLRGKVVDRVLNEILMDYDLGKIKDYVFNYLNVGIDEDSDDSIFLRIYFPNYCKTVEDKVCYKKEVGAFWSSVSF